MYTHQKQYVTAGVPAAKAEGALIVIHGRGSTAQNMIGLADEFNVENFAIYAPQATNNSWYPYSFLAPEAENQPALSSALEIIEQLVQQIIADGIPEEKIYFAGFSQGACLTLEFVAQHAQQYGGVVAFTGGLIGQNLNPNQYQGNFSGTPIFISTGDPDPHVPLTRVEESVKILENLGAAVTFKVYKGRPHTISQPEIDLANQYVFSQKIV